MDKIDNGGMLLNDYFLGLYLICPNSEHHSIRRDNGHPESIISLSDQECDHIPDVWTMNLAYELDRNEHNIETKLKNLNLSEGEYSLLKDEITKGLRDDKVGFLPYFKDMEFAKHIRSKFFPGVKNIRLIGYGIKKTLLNENSKLHILKEQHKYDGKVFPENGKLLGYEVVNVFETHISMSWRSSLSFSQIGQKPTENGLFMNYEDALKCIKFIYDNTDDYDDDENDSNNGRWIPMSLVDYSENCK